MVNLSDLEVGRVGGEQTGSARLGGCEVDLRVDVDGDTSSARRPDDGFDDELVGDEVIAGAWAVEFGAQSSLLFISKKEIKCKREREIPELARQKSNRSRLDYR